MIDTRLNILRNRSSSLTEFRTASDKLARILAHQHLSKLEKAVPIGRGIHHRSMMLVPILRSGLALLPAFLAALKATET